MFIDYNFIFIKVFAIFFYLDKIYLGSFLFKNYNKCLETPFNLVSFLFCIQSGKNFVNIRAKPLQIWDKHVKNGHIKRIMDSDMQSSVLEIAGANISTNFINCPADPNQTLGIKMPYLVLLIKYVREILKR